MSGAENAPAEAPALETPIAEYSPTAAALAQLRHRFAGVVFDVTTSKGNAEARAARLELVRLRTGLEAKRKELKAPALERARLIDTEAKRIAEAIGDLEDPIDEQIRADEARRERERQERIAAEQKRVDEINARIADMRSLSVGAAAEAPDTIEALIRKVIALELPEATFAEFTGAANIARSETLQALRAMHTAAVTREAERAELEELRRQAAERAEADRQRAEAERQAEEQRRLDEQARIARELADRQAELDRQRAEQQRLDEEAAERRRQADEQARRQREADDRAAAERREAEERELEARRAEVARQEAEARAEREERERVEREERERVLAAEQAARDYAAAEERLRAENERRAQREREEAERARLSKLHAGAQELLDAAVAACTAHQDYLGAPDGARSEPLTVFLDAMSRLDDAAVACR